MDNWLIHLLVLLLLVVILDGVRRAYLKHRKMIKNLSIPVRNKSRVATESSGETVSPSRVMNTEQSAAAREPIMQTNTAHEQRPVEEVVRKQSEMDFIGPNTFSQSQELSGSVRVVERRKAEAVSKVNRQVQQNFYSSRKTLAGSNPKREEDNFDTDATVNNLVKGEIKTLNQTVPSGESTQIAKQKPLDLEQQLPTLMNSVSEGRQEPTVGAPMSIESLEATVATQKPQTATHSDMETVSSARPDDNFSHPLDTSAVNKAQQPPLSQERQVDELLVLNIVAPTGNLFEGNDLLRVFLSSNLRFGEMDIFHFYRDGADEGPVLFSLANIVVPGTFDLAQMEDFTTRGVSLFLTLPVAGGGALKALDNLFATAWRIAEQLGGELKDENRSVFTAQTAEHYRQRVMEHQRRKALAKAQV